jgi:hypothetical protein
VSENKDRRYIDRIMIPGAKVYYKKSNGVTLFKRYRGPLYLADITKSTMSVPEKLLLHIKTNLDLKIVIPENQIINMKGIISGFETDINSQSVKTIIQFNPFGHGKKYNSFRSKKKLGRFLAHYYQSGK